MAGDRHHVTARRGPIGHVAAALRSGALLAGIAVAVATALLHFGTNGAVALVVLGIGSSILGAILGVAAADIDEVVE